MLRFDPQGIDRRASTAEFDYPLSDAHHAPLPPQNERPVEAGAESARPQGQYDALDAESTLPFSLDELAAADQSFSWETNQPTAETGTEEMVRFSLSELGLTDEELAALDEQPETAANTTAGSDPGLAPFSLAELGWSNDEIAALDLGDGLTAAQDPAVPTSDNAARRQGETTLPSEVATDDQPEVLPFSMADLGLTDDELALFSDEPNRDVATGAARETEEEDYGSMLSGLDVFTQPEQDSAGNVSAEEDQTEWLDLQAELDVDIPPTRTPDDFLMDAKVTHGDVQSVLETMPTENTEDDARSVVPFSLADLGLNDEELPLFDQAPSSRNFGNQPHAAPDDAAPESPFADPGSLDRLFATEAPRSAFEQVDSSEALAADNAGEAYRGPVDSSAPVIANPDPLSATHEDPAPGSNETASEPSRLETAWDRSSADAVASGAAAQVSGDEREQPLPTELPEGARPLAAVAEAPAVDAAAPQPAQTSGDYSNGIAAIHAQLAADPENNAMRLAVARMSQSMNDTARAFEQYRLLIKRGRLLDEVVVDLQDTIAENEDPQMLRRLHRLLGDAYMKQSRIREAMDAYSWTLPRSS